MPGSYRYDTRPSGPNRVRSVSLGKQGGLDVFREDLIYSFKFSPQTPVDNFSLIYLFLVPFERHREAKMAGNALIVDNATMRFLLTWLDADLFEIGHGFRLEYLNSGGTFFNMEELIDMTPFRERDEQDNPFFFKSYDLTSQFRPSNFGLNLLRLTMPGYRFINPLEQNVYAVDFRFTIDYHTE